MLARQIAIGFGIAIIFPLLVYYGTSTFFPAPKRADYFRAAPPTSTPEERKANFEVQQKSEAAFGQAARAFSRVLILVATPLGVAAIFVGTLIPLHSIGTGLILGGILTVGYGYWFYWAHLEDWVRFVSLLAGFGILAFVGYWQFSRGRLTAN